MRIKCPSEKTITYIDRNSNSVKVQPKTIHVFHDIEEFISFLDKGIINNINFCIEFSCSSFENIAEISILNNKSKEVFKTFQCISLFLDYINGAICTLDYSFKVIT
jgi:hypothetical protein